MYRMLRLHVCLREHTGADRPDVRQKQYVVFQAAAPKVTSFLREKKTRRSLHRTESLPRFDVFEHKRKTAAASNSQKKKYVQKPAKIQKKTKFEQKDRNSNVYTHRMNNTRT